MSLPEALVNARDVQEPDWAQEGPDGVWKMEPDLEVCHFFGFLLGIKVP